MHSDVLFITAFQQKCIVICHKSIWKQIMQENAHMFFMCVGLFCTGVQKTKGFLKPVMGPITHKKQ